jgi:hypothetical protein
MPDLDARRWRAAALVQAGGWLAMLVVACGGGDDAATPVPAVGTAARLAQAGTGAPELPSRRADIARQPHAAPCVDTTQQWGTAAPPAVPVAAWRTPVLGEAELGDDALALGRPGAAADTAPRADPFAMQ